MSDQYELYTRLIDRIERCRPEDFYNYLNDAIENDNIQQAETLLNIANSTLRKDLYQGLLEGAILDSTVTVVRFLLDHGIGPNMSIDDIFNYISPLETAVGYNKIEIFHILLDYGADPNPRCLGHGTVLQLATQKDNLEMVNVLLHHGVDPNNSRESPLFYLTDGPNRIQIADLLIKAGADINIRDYDGNARCYDGNTLLHIYAVSRDYELTKYFLNLGLDPNAQNDNGETPLNNGYPINPNVIQLLIDFGSDPNIPNNSGRTVFDTIKFYLNHNYMDQVTYNEILEILNSFQEQPIKSALEFKEY